MKTTSILTTLVLSFFTATAISQSTNALTLVTSLPLNDAAHILFQPSGELEIAYWDHDYAQVEININADGFSRNQLKALLPTGIFQVVVNPSDDAATIEMPAFGNIVKIGNKPFLPRLSFKVTMPRHMEIERPKTSEDSIAKAN